MSAKLTEEAEPIDFSNVEIEPLFKDFVDFETFSKSDFRAVKVKDCVAVPKSKKLLQFTLDDGPLFMYLSRRSFQILIEIYELFWYSVGKCRSTPDITV